MTKIIIPDSKVNAVKEDSALVIKEAGELSVGSWQECEQAAFFLTKVVTRTKRIEELYDAFVKPFENALKDSKNMLKSLGQPYEKVEEAVRETMKTFLSDYYEEFEKRAAKSKEPLERPEFKIQTPGGLVFVTERMSYEVVDLDKVPKEYLETVVNGKKINEAIGNGETEIPGLKIARKPTISVRQ